MRYFTFGLILVMAIFLPSGKRLNPDKILYGEVVYDEIDGLIIVPVSFTYGGKVYNFLFDTGSPSAVFNSIKEVSGIVPKGKRRMRSPSGNGWEAEVGEIDSLYIGSVVFNNVPAFLNEVPSLSFFECYNIDGILGADCMHPFVWKIDPELNVISFASNIEQLENKPYEAEVQLYYRLNDYQPFIKAQINSDSFVELIFDTGMNDFITLSSNAINNHFVNIFDSNRIIVERGFKTINLAGVETCSESKSFVVQNFKIQDIGLSNIIIKTDSDRFNRLGTEIFKSHKICIDFLRKKIYFSSFKNNPESFYSIFSFGFGVFPENNLLLVNYLIEDIQFDKILALGDTILSLNGINVFPFTGDCQLVDKLKKEMKNDTVILEFFRQKKIIKKSFKRRLFLGNSKH